MTTRHHTIALALAAALTATLSITGCAVTRQQQDVSEYVSDAALTTKVKAKFADNTTVSATSISVETLNSTVQLAGFAKSSEERATAEMLARQTKGVKDVRNDIVVKP